MYIPLKLLCLLWWPCTVLSASLQVLIQSAGAGFNPGDTLSYTLVADPIPSGELGIILIPVQSGDPNTPRAFTIFSATMAYSPQKFTLTIPGGLAPDSFYTLDGHADTSVYSALLGNSDPFEISVPSTSIVTTPVVTPTKQTTKITVTQTAPTSAKPSTTQLEGSTTTEAVTTSPTSQHSSSLPDTSSSSSIIAATSVLGASQGSSIPATASNTAADESITPSTSDVSVNGSLAAKHKSSPVGAIVGGVIGGLVTIVLLLLALFVCHRRRQRRQHVPFSPTETTSLAPATQQTPSPSASGYLYREFQPNRPSLPGISPFLVNNELQEWSPAPDLSNAKSREAFGGGTPQHFAASPSVSLSMASNRESVAATAVSQDALRSERQRILTEISALRTGTSTGATGQTRGVTPSIGSMWAGSSGSAAGSEDETAEMRERLEQLTHHVRRLETALEQVSHAYDAPPMYEGSQR